MAIVNKLTPIYGSRHVIKQRPNTATRGTTNPRQLKSFLTEFFDQIPFSIKLSLIILDNTINNQKNMYGTAEMIPFLKN